MPEKICPGGSSPDPNVIFCDDFGDGSWLTNPQWDANDCNGYEAVRCDNNSYGYNSPCAAWTGNPLYFDGAWGYGCHRAISPNFGAEYSELYTRAYIYFSSPYSWGYVDDKGIYLLHSADWNALQSTWLDYSAWGSGNPDISNYALSGQYRYQNQGNDITLQPGEWYLVEFYVKLNTPGMSDGIIRMWADKASTGAQTLRLEHTNLLIRQSGNNHGYDTVWLNLYHNGCQEGAAGHPELCPPTINQWMKWSNIVVSKARIGPINNASCPNVKCSFQLNTI